MIANLCGAVVILFALYKMMTEGGAYYADEVVPVEGGE